MTTQNLLLVVRVQYVNLRVDGAHLTDTLMSLIVRQNIIIRTLVTIVVQTQVTN